MAETKLDQILDRIQNKNLPPLHLWDPPLTGEMDMHIAADGSWYYQGSKIERQPMVKLFSTILTTEGEDHFLVTPVEKYKISVEDAPFVAIEVDRINMNPPFLLFRTNVDDEVIADSTHQINVMIDPVTSEPRPYLHIRDGLKALIHRNVFYQLVEWSQPIQKNETTFLQVESQGHKFELGSI